MTQLLRDGGLALSAAIDATDAVAAGSSVTVTLPDYGDAAGVAHALREIGADVRRAQAA